MTNSRKKILTVIQARRGSTRLPDKILMPLSGKAMLARMFERVAASQIEMMTVVATTILPEDDVVEELCDLEKIGIFRGHPTDLLDRHYKAALEYGADIVVKIPSDCPLISPDVIENVISFFLDNEEKYDFVSNLHPQSYPDGNDVEVMPLEILRIAWEEASKDYEREHTTPFIWDNPERFRIGNCIWESGLDYSMSHRFTVDYPEDYEFVKTVFEKLYIDKNIFLLGDILQLLEQRPELMEINRMHAGISWYRHHKGELKNI